MTDKDTLQSPRIAALRQELEAGNSSALDAFWQEVAEVVCWLCSRMAAKAAIQSRKY